MPKYLRIVIFLVLILFMISCKSKIQQENDKLESDLRTFFTVNLKERASTLDSFSLIRVDTISQQMLLDKQADVLDKQVHKLIDKRRSNIQEMSNTVDQMRLSAAINSKTLFEIEKKEIEKLKKRAELLRSEIDTVMSIIQSIDSSANIADSTKPVGFGAICFFQIRHKDNSVKRDTAFITLNINKDIVDKDDFLNLPYKIDFAKFD